MSAAVSFSESMAGRMVFGATEPHSLPRAAAGAATRIRVSILVADIDAFVADPAHRGRISGVVDLSPWGTGMPVRGGTFQLFVDSGDPTLKWMVYEVGFEHGGRSYYLAGKKDVREGPVTHLWHDTTTLYAQLHEGIDRSGPVIGAGILRLGFSDLLRMMLTFRSPDAPSTLRGAGAIFRFLGFFAAQLWASYVWHHRASRRKPVPGGTSVNDGGSDLIERFPPLFGERRSLKIPPLQRIELKAGDGKTLLLHHTSGGTRGPIILTPGTAMTALSYCIDTVPQNLVEFLVAQGFDVWLFDWRTSPLLNSHNSPYTFDDVARYDWPAGIAEVRRRTGQEQVTVLAHCLSSPCLLLSLVRGYAERTQLRAFAASQVALHLKLTPVGMVKANLHLDALLPAGQMVHQQHADETWQRSDMAVSVLARVLPKTYVCDNRACDRQSATFGELILHSRVDPATHGLIGDLVPECIMGFLKNAATGVRSSSLLSDEDLTHLDRLRLPILFMSGSENRMFIPASTEATYQMLRTANGPGFYRRQVYQGFGHLDCYLGAGAPELIWPDIAAALG